MKRTWKKVFAFVCALTIVAVPVTYTIVNADVPIFNELGGLNNASADMASADQASADEASADTASEESSTGTDYMITIPPSLSVANAGWNATDGITAKVKDGDTFDSSKKLTVTATSENNWALKSGNNDVGYNLAATEAEYIESATPASWEFSADELNGGTNKAMGIIVEDYSGKPAGNYQDTVIFTANVTEAAETTTTVTWNSSNVSDFYVFGNHHTYTNEGITLAGNSEMSHAMWEDIGTDAGAGFLFMTDRMPEDDYMSEQSGGFTFTAPVGKKFTKIEMTCTPMMMDMAVYENRLGSGWPSGDEGMENIFETGKITWTGNASSTVGLLTNVDNNNPCEIFVTSIEFTFEDSDSNSENGAVDTPATNNEDIIHVSNVILNESNITLTLYTNEEFRLTATVLPENATEKNVTWTSSNPGVASVSDGQIYAESVGQADITATADGISSVCHVTVIVEDETGD